MKAQARRFFAAALLAIALPVAFLALEACKALTPAEVETEGQAVLTFEQETCIAAESVLGVRDAAIVKVACGLAEAATPVVSHLLLVQQAGAMRAASMRAQGIAPGDVAPPELGSAPAP